MKMQIATDGAVSVKTRLQSPAYSSAVAAFELVIFRFGDSLLPDGKPGQAIGDGRE